MKITDVKIHVLKSQLTEPFAFSQGWVKQRSATLVEVFTDEGITGWGEAFAQGLGVKTENFKSLVVEKSFRSTQRRMWAEKGYATQLEGFFKGIQQGRPPAVTVLDGVRSTVGCLKMLESARNLCPVAIDVEAMLR